MSLQNSDEVAMPDTDKGNEYHGFEQSVMSNHSSFHALVSILRGRLFLENTTENTARIQRALAFASVSATTTPVSVAIIVSEFLLAVEEDRKEQEEALEHTS